MKKKNREMKNIKAGVTLKWAIVKLPPWSTEAQKSNCHEGNSSFLQ